MKIKTNTIFFTFFFVLILTKISVSQNTKIDSLKKVISLEKNDSTKVIQLYTLFNCYQSEYMLKNCENTANEALSIANKTKIKNNIGIANLIKGINFKDYEEYPSSQTFLLVALKNLSPIENKKQLGDANSYMGYIQEQLNNFDKAISYHRTALKLRSEINEKLTTNSLLRLATCFGETKQFDSAYFYFYKGIKLQFKLNNKSNLTGLYNNLGITFDYDNKKDSALVYYQKSLSLNLEIGDSVSIAGTLINIGGLYVKLNNNEKAIEYFKRGLLIAKKIGFKQWIANGAKDLGEIYYVNKEYKLAYESYKLGRDYNDSIFQETKLDEIANAEEKYQTDKKQKELEIADLKIKRQGDELNKSNAQRIFLVIGLLISLIIFGLVFWGYRKMKKLSKELSQTNKEVVNQNSIIEEKNKDITDSIQYAKQIQNALLFSDNLFAENFADYFILFKPKDIVSGDFYWAHKTENEILIANADCTGHGVPGAFMSLIGVSKLNEIVKEKKIFDTSKIMNLLRDGILDIFSSDNPEQQKKDGMDMVMMRYNFKTKAFQFSCANNPLWLLRDGELLKFKADKFPVGFSYGEIQPFKLNEITLKTGDIVLTFSDGYADQFGGPNEKKFKYKNLQKIIVDSSTQPLSEMKQLLYDNLINWQGNLEQVDDITIIGFKI